MPPCVKEVMQATFNHQEDLSEKIRKAVSMIVTFLLEETETATISGEDDQDDHNDELC